VTNTSRFKKAGDYQTLEILGFSIIVIRGKDDQIRTFHNICRHRAYTVTKKAFGSSTVLGCRYHGWSYDTKGKLIKAPEFDTLPGFDKTMNGLWEVKTQVHFNMVFINFDGSNMTAPLNLDGIGAIMKSWDISKLVFVSDWKVEGGFNWKLMGNLWPKVNYYYCAN
jgi:phenylpropionate dioxygenase-like ring-hydroxylating dioxygenase large terminal subunit